MSNSAGSRPERRPTKSQIEKWGQNLYSRSLLFARAIQHKALRNLAGAARQQNRTAVQILAEAAVRHPSAELRAASMLPLAELTWPSAITVVWQVWERTRSGALAGVLVGLNQLATTPPVTRVLSCLVLDSVQFIKETEAEEIQALIAIADQVENPYAAAAQAWLKKLSDPTAVDIFCQQWQARRSPWMTEILLARQWIASAPPQARALTALANGKPEIITQGSLDLVAPTCAELLRADPLTASWAKFALQNLAGQAQIDACAAQWYETRAPALEAVLRTSGSQPHSPEIVRLAAAFKMNREFPLASLTPAAIDALIRLLADGDPSLAAGACKTLEELPEGELRESLCELVITQGSVPAAKICIAQNYLPQEPARQAVFLFLTEQWDAYRSLDFDLRLLKAVASTAAPELRSRIAALIQKSGQIDFLPILSGKRASLNLNSMAPAEIPMLIQLVRDAQDMPRLWDLGKQVSYFDSLKIIRELIRQGFTPAHPAEIELYHQLCGYAQQELPENAQDFSAQTPPAVRKAQLNVSGRVNTFAFSPNANHLAIGTNQRQVVLWDFQQAKIAHLQHGFRRSIGKVCYANDGRLWIGERTNSSASCGLYRLRDQHLDGVGSHAGSILGLFPIGNSRVISIGRDQRLCIWDGSRPTPVVEQSLSFWPRTACLSPDGSRLYLFTHTLHAYTLPDLTPLRLKIHAADPGARANSTCSACACDGEGNIFAVRQNRSVLCYQPVQDGVLRLLHTSSAVSMVPALRTLPGRREMLLAQASGEIFFSSQPGSANGRQIRSPHGLTTIEVSPDGETLAVGQSENKVALWDMQTLSIADLASTPIEIMRKDQYNRLREIEANLSAGAVDRAVQYMLALLQHRFRYDIELSAPPRLTPGEFDIVLEPDPQESPTGALPKEQG